MVPDEDAAQRGGEGNWFPLIIKASEGGGGRGMRIVREKSELLTAFQTARSGSGTGFRKPERLHGEADRTASAYRVSGAGRSARKRGSSGRARVFDSAAASEAAGGVAVAGGGRENSEEDGRSGSRGAHENRVFERGNCRISARGIGQALLHRDERADSGGTPGDGDGDRRGPREIADSNCRGRKTLRRRRAGRVSRTCDRVPHQC